MKHSRRDEDEDKDVDGNAEAEGKRRAVHGTSKTGSVVPQAD